MFVRDPEGVLHLPGRKASCLQRDCYGARTKAFDVLVA